MKSESSGVNLVAMASNLLGMASNLRAQYNLYNCKLNKPAMDSSLRMSSPGARPISALVLAAMHRFSPCPATLDLSCQVNSQKQQHSMFSLRAPICINVLRRHLWEVLMRSSVSGQA